MDKEITREEEIVVARVYDNSYGDLLWTDKAGKEYKVSNKRVKYFEKIIQPNVAVKLYFALTTAGKEYVNKAERVDDLLPPPTKPGEPLPEHQEEIKKALPAPQGVGQGGYKADPAKMDSIERQVSIKLACEIASDTETLDQIFEKADKIYQWIRK